MTNQLPPLPEDDSHWEETIQSNPQPPQRRAAPDRPPQTTGQQPPVQRQPRQPTNYNIERVRRQRQQQTSQKDSVLYFPLWSLGLMLMVVLVLTFAIVFLVVAMGGRGSVAEADPEIQIVTAAATFTPNIPDPDEIVLATPTIPVDIQVILPAQTPVDQSLDGPLLPTVAFTETPRPLTIGERVIVANVGDQELNVRDIAGVTSSQVLFRSPEGSIFTIVEGPQQADGFTWWRIQDATNGQSGWAVANYLVISE